MTVRVAINGFGRIGRLVLRSIVEHEALCALKAYSDLAKQSGVRVSLTEVSRAGGTPIPLFPESTGLIQSNFSAKAGALRFGLAQGGGRDLGAFYQVTEAGFDTGVPTQRIADGLEVFREIIGPDGKFWR